MGEVGVQNKKYFPRNCILEGGGDILENYGGWAADKF